MVVFAFLLAAPKLLAAQCPDGSVPPCRGAAVRAVPIDANALAILPFRVSGPPEAGYLQEGMVDLLNVGLDGFAGWRVLQPRAFLRQVGARDRVIAVGDAARMARAAGAGAFVLGSVTAVGPELVAQAGLYESARGTQVASVRARGSAALPAAVADSISAGLARYRASSRTGIARRPTSEYTTASPQALQAYLVAEQLARRGHWAESIDSLTAAIGSDSTFALAYYALFRALSWGTATPIIRVQWGTAATTLTIESVYLAATRHRHRAPPRQQRLLEVIGVYNRVAAVRAFDALVLAFPDDADVALEAGDGYFHIAVPMGEPPRRALELLERAIALDPGAPEPYLHAVQLHAMMGDSSAAWRTLDRLRTVAPGWTATPGLELGLRAFLRGEDPATLAAVDADLLRRAARYVLWSGDSIPARAQGIADAFTARVTVPAMPRAERVNALIHRHLLGLGRGQFMRAWGLLRDVLVLDAESGEVLGAVVLHHLVTGTHEEEAVAAARQLFERPGERPLWAASLLGRWTATRAPLDSARSALPGLLAGPDLPAFRAAVAAGLTGLVELRRGDSAEARHELMRSAGEWYETRGVEAFFPGPYLALLAARLDVALGEPALAIPKLSEVMATLAPHLRAEAEELRGQIEERRGNRAAAVRAYRNFVALWSDADPPLQPRVQAARAALARLESGSR